MRNLLLSSMLVAACGPATRPGTDPDAAVAIDTQVVDMSRVYAHSGQKLYRVDTQTLKPVEIGTMAGLGTQSLTDLAIDNADVMVGITLDKLYRIDASNAQVTLIRDLSQSARGFTSLSYVPDPANSSQDILVSANDQGNVFRIDAATGNATMIGSYGTVPGGTVISSGDLIGVRGFGIYATVNIGTDPNDFLAKIDPVTWKATPLGTGTGFDKIFGLGYWAGTIYGFVDMGTNAGQIIQIDPNTGAGTVLDTNAIRWFGAGVATDAPILQ